MLAHHSLDLEAKTLMDMLALGRWTPVEVPDIERKVYDRRAWIEAGLSSPTAAHWTAKLQTLDPQLRLRWDFKDGWVVERNVESWGCWAVCGVLGMRCVPLNLLDILRAGDMQRYAPGEYLRLKREAAAAKVDANDRAGTALVAAAVDKLTDKRIKEFVSVERAIQTGEPIVARGETERMLSHMHQASYAAEQTAERTVGENPHMHPLKLKRKTGGAHVRQP
jgi:hypothetical protein